MFFQKTLLKHLSSVANVASRSSLLPSTENNFSRLPNGLLVASTDLQGAVSQLIIAYKAGSRYEQTNESGLVHHLRNIIGSDSANYLGVKLLWQSGNIGSNVIASASKDLFLVHMSVNRTFANIGLSLLGEFSQPAFKPWDTVNAAKTLLNDLMEQEPYDIVIECLHKAAYRNGSLANSLLAANERIGKITFKELNAYAKSRLVSSEAALIGINVDHSVLLEYANGQKIIPNLKAKHAIPSPYIGGDSRIVGDTPLAHVAIAGQGAMMSDKKNIATLAVLSHLIGKDSNLKFSDVNNFGAVAQSVYNVANLNKVAVSAINIVHSDSGLAGVYLVAEGDKIELYVKVAIEALRNLALNGVDIEKLSIAKKLVQVKSNVNCQNTVLLAHDYSSQLLMSNSADFHINFIDTVEEVKNEDIKNAAAKIVSKISIAAYGKINQVPYADQI